MLSKGIHEALLTRYGVRPADARREIGFGGFATQSVGGFHFALAGEHEALAVAVFIDIAGFSKRIDGHTAWCVRAFLDNYYATVIPEVFALGGMIERIAGDGVLAIFCSSFGLAPEAVTPNAVLAARRVVERLHGGDYPAKAALSRGHVLFCKTGLASVYEDVTVVGHPITEVYRMEEIALAHQVVHREDSSLLATCAPGWSAYREVQTLRGVNSDQPLAIVRQVFQHQ